MVWPCFKVFWFSKDNPTGHSERKKKKRQTEEDVGRQYQRGDKNGLRQPYVEICIEWLKWKGFCPL